MLYRLNAQESFHVSKVARCNRIVAGLSQNQNTGIARATPEALIIWYPSIAEAFIGCCW